MKKIWITILLTITTISNADYLAKFPLEATNGGSLPTGSINIGSGSSNETPEVRCQYEYNENLGNSTTWAYRSVGARTSLIWNKEVILLQAANIPDSIDINGYKYSKGTLQTQVGVYTLYEICRDKI